MRVVMLALVVMLSACQAMSDKPHVANPAQHHSAEIQFAGGNGDSMEDAVVILGAGNSMQGIRAERDWIVTNRPGFRKVGQALVQSENKVYDRIDIENAEGKRVALYFDITDFFGKW